MKLQVALDTLTLEDCLTLLEETKGSVDIAEVGTPFIIEEGMRPVREFKKHFPDIEVLADAKIMDAAEELDVILEAILSQCKKQGFSFVYGKGKRKTPIQRIYDNLADYRDTLESCLTRIQICGEGRNSYSKTDHDATMMHMKEDYYMKTRFGHWSGKWCIYGSINIDSTVLRG